jgi:hypothetical protein
MSRSVVRSEVLGFKYVSRSLLYVSRSLLTLADTCWQRYVVWQAPQGAQAQRDGADR